MNHREHGKLVGIDLFSIGEGIADRDDAEWLQGSQGTGLDDEQCDGSGAPYGARMQTSLTARTGSVNPKRTQVTV